MGNIYEIIAAELSGGSLSNDEYTRLNLWKECSDENRKIYALLQRLHAAGRDIRDSGMGSLDDARREVWESIGKRQKKKQLRRLCYLAGAAVVACLLSVMSFFLLSDRDNSPEFTGMQEQRIAAGTAKALLRLGNGQIVSLSADHRAVISVDSLFKISNMNSTLTYAGTGNFSTREPEYNTLTVPVGAEYTLLLSDSSRVFLNSGSELRYPVVFGSKKRDVFLTGEAYFDIRKDTERVFQVHTNTMDICVLGTSFNVNAYEEKVARATLVSGKLLVNCANKAYEVTPGKQFSYDQKNLKAELREVDTELYTSWKDGYYQFDKARLEEIMSTLSLWYDLQIDYPNQTVKNLRFTGRLKRYDDAWELLKKIEETGAVRFTIDEKKISITSK